MSAYLRMHQGNDNQLHRPEFKDITDDVLQTCEHAQELDRRCKHVGELDSGHIQIILCVCVCVAMIQFSIGHYVQYVGRHKDGLFKSVFFINIVLLQ